MIKGLNMDNFQHFQNTYGVQLEPILGAIVILLIGWVIALLAGAGVRKLLSKLSVNRHVNSSTGHQTDIERIAGRVTFWFILIIAIIASFNLLNLHAVSAPFSNMVNEVLIFIPRVLSALVLGVLGWVLATVVRAAITRLLARTSLDERLSAEVGVQPLSNNIGQIIYWLILLLFVPLVLSALGLNGLLLPVQNMVNDLLVFLPHVFAAAVIGFVGYFVAKIVRNIVVGLVSSLNVQSAAERAGVPATTNLPKIAGSIVFILILIPTLIAALDALQIEAISQPAIRMLDQIMYAIPNIIAAALILIITYMIAKFVAGILVGLISGTEVDRLPAKLNMQRFLGGMSVSEIIGKLIIFFAMLFAVAEAANRLGFDQVSDLISIFIAFGANVLLGVAIFVIGFWLANLIGSIVERGQYNYSVWLANVVRVLIIGLVLAMGLRAMGIADSIVNLAFGLTLGAVAVAFALAFGLGGREPAARLLDDMLNKAKEHAHKPNPAAEREPMSNADMEVPLATSMGSPVVSPSETAAPENGTDMISPGLPNISGNNNPDDNNSLG
ncbi:mechanosensitive ion channel [Alkanindiges sp. WGS2144]|uniref:mechanosensitive ion channel n=1 Tax=Alkanindiges sp. WGS2144 TaxID=3366808 RepID=UPI00375204DF